MTRAAALRAAKGHTSHYINVPQGWGFEVSIYDIGGWTLNDMATYLQEVGGK